MPACFAYVTIDDLVCRFVNRAFEVGFGRPREEIVGKSVREIIGDANTEFAVRYIEEVRQGRSTHYENTFDLETGKSRGEVRRTWAGLTAAKSDETATVGQGGCYRRIRGRRDGLRRDGVAAITSRHALASSTGIRYRR